MEKKKGVPSDEMEDHKHTSVVVPKCVNLLQMISLANHACQLKHLKVGNNLYLQHFQVGTLINSPFRRIPISFDKFHHFMLFAQTKCSFIHPSLHACGIL